MKVRNNNVLSDAPIFIIGFMGAGKTTVGRELARHLGYRFIDLDEQIVEKIGKSIREIFSELGEAEFRKLESAAIHSCSDLDRSVVALGGGAYVKDENRMLVRAIGKSVWLDCPFETCLERISGDKSRPLLSNVDDMKVLFDQRRSAYAQADYRVQTSSLSTESLVVEIITLLQG